MAYVSGGDLMVTDQPTALASDISGRPSWSAGGGWIAFNGPGGILVVPADGSGPAAPLPGLGGAGDPAWQPSSPLGAPSAPFLTGNIIADIPRPLPPVPIPAAAWLFGTALIGLVGFSKRRKSA